MTAATIHFRGAPSCSADVLAASLRSSLRDPLRGRLLRMLREAPGFACDLASGLRRDPRIVQAALDALVDAELLIAVPEAGDRWYTLSADQVEEWLDAARPTSRHRSAWGPGAARSKP